MRTEAPTLGALAMIERRDYQGTLEYVNGQREGFGLAPLVFLPRATGCRNPLEVALPPVIWAGPGALWLRWARGYELRPNPPAVIAFMDAFGRGEFPDLERLPGVTCSHDTHRVSCPQSHYQQSRRGLPPQRVA